MSGSANGSITWWNLSNWQLIDLIQTGASKMTLLYQDLLGIISNRGFFAFNLDNRSLIRLSEFDEYSSIKLLNNELVALGGMNITLFNLTDQVFD